MIGKLMDKLSRPTLMTLNSFLIILRDRVEIYIVRAKLIYGDDFESTDPIRKNQIEQMDRRVNMIDIVKANV